MNIDLSMFGGVYALDKNAQHLVVDPFGIFISMLQ